MKKPKRLLFITPILSSFIRIDKKILEENYDLTLNHDDWKTKWKTPIMLLKQFFVLIFSIKRYDLIVVSFGGYWALVPSVLGKWFKVPCYIILHGTDCASIPSLGYGNLRGKILRNTIKLSYESAKLLIPVSNSLIKIRNSYNNVEEEFNQGYKSFFPNIETETITIHNGIDSKFWINVNKVERKSNLFLAVFSTNQFYLKGGDLILELAKNFPNLEFKIVGCDKPRIDVIPNNINFLGVLDQETLRDYYFEAKYYFQLSVYEGFGCALCEAMLCACIPIVSSVNMLPEIINGSGYVLENRSIEELQKIIAKLDSSSIDQNKIVQSIQERFSVTNRKERLLEALEK